MSGQRARTGLSRAASRGGWDEGWRQSTRRASLVRRELESASETLLPSAHLRRGRHRYETSKLQKTLSKRRVVGIVNLAVFVILSTYVASLVRNGGEARMATIVFDSKRLDQLPYPLNIVAQVRRRNISVSTPLSHKTQPGYVGVKPGTFRSKYPSLDIAGTGTFDEVYVLTSDKCDGQWQEFLRHANAVSMSVVKWPVQDSKHISLTSPPLPVAASALQDTATGNTAVMSILKRQISYLEAHRRIWKHVADTDRQRVLILDDTLFPNERLLKSMPSLFTNADQESVAGQKPWHFIFFRRKRLPLQIHEQSLQHPEIMWSMNPRYSHAVVRAKPSIGAGMYALSSTGAKWLLEHVPRYRVPLDLEIALLQRDFPEEFVTLSACNNDTPKEFCPEIVKEIPVPDSKHLFECVWRRLQEKRLSG